MGTMRRQALAVMLTELCKLAREHRVDAVTIAGDLYNQYGVIPQTVELLASQFAALYPVRVFIAPGQADPYLPNSPYTVYPWPDNVHIFARSVLERVDCAPGVSLWGAAYPAGRGHMALDNTRVNGEGQHLLLLHAVQADRAGLEQMFYVNDAAVRSAGFAFALLGSAHEGRLTPESGAIAAYPGSPEVLYPDEQGGRHGAVLLTVEDGRCEPTWIDTARWRYVSRVVDVGGCSTPEKIVARVLDRLEHELTTVHSVTLMGIPQCPVIAADIQRAIATKTDVHVLVSLRLDLPRDLDSLKNEPTVRGTLVRRLDQQTKGVRSAEDVAQQRAALHLALQALDGKKVLWNEIDPD